jgi:hypothetical protein
MLSNYQFMEGSFKVMKFECKQKIISYQDIPNTLSQLLSAFTYVTVRTAWTACVWNK